MKKKEGKKKNGTPLFHCSMFCYVFHPFFDFYYFCYSSPKYLKDLVLRDSVMLAIYIVQAPDTLCMSTVG